MRMSAAERMKGCPEEAVRIESRDMSGAMSAGSLSISRAATLLLQQLPKITAAALQRALQFAVEALLSLGQGLL